MNVKKGKFTASPWFAPLLSAVVVALLSGGSLWIISTKEQDRIDNRHLVDIAQAESRRSTEVAQKDNHHATDVAVLFLQMEWTSTAEYKHTQTSLGLHPPASTPTRVPTFTPADNKPTQAVYDYYEKINAGNYSEAWRVLSPKFQLNSNNGDFEGYVEYWEATGIVEVQEVTVQEISDKKATLLVTLYFDQSRIYESYIYQMVFSIARDQWEIDGVDFAE